MNDADLRHLLGTAVSDTSPSPDLADRAVALGRRRLRRQRRVTTVASGAAVVLGSAAALTLAFAVSPSAPAAVAAVSCSRTATTVTASQVVARPSGATLDVNNSSGGPLELMADGQGAFLPPGRSTLVLPLAPGRHELACVGSRPTTAAALDVVDAGHIFTPAQLPCARPILRDLSRSSYILQGDPRQLTAWLLHVPETETRIFGYPAATARTVAVELDGHVIKTVTWHQLVSDDVWTPGVIEQCP